MEYSILQLIDGGIILLQVRVICCYSTLKRRVKTAKTLHCGFTDERDDFNRSSIQRDSYLGRPATTVDPYTSV